MSYDAWRLLLDTAHALDASLSQHKAGVMGGIPRSLAALFDDAKAQLTVLKRELSRAHSAEDADRMLFALVCLYDERVLQLVQGKPIAWPPLQVALLKTDDGGEDLFGELDAALRDIRTPSLVFEVFFYTLQQGFRGRFEGDMAGIEEYKRRLVERFDLPALDLSAGEAEAPGYDWSDRFPWRTWAVAGGIIVAVNLIIVLAGVL